MSAWVSPVCGRVYTMLSIFTASTRFSECTGSPVNGDPTCGEACERAGAAASRSRTASRSLTHDAILVVAAGGGKLSKILGRGGRQLDGVELPERAERGEPALAVAAVGVDAPHHGDLSATGQHGADHADVGYLVAAQVRALYLEGDPLARRDPVVIERRDGRRAAVSHALGVERRGADRVLNHGVRGEQAQPPVAVSRRDGRLGPPRELTRRRSPVRHAVFPARLRGPARLPIPPHCTVFPRRSFLASQSRWRRAPPARGAFSRRPTWMPAAPCRK